MEIIEKITLEEILDSKPEMIFYAARTCWWTHDPEHLSTLPPSESDIQHYAETFRLNSSTPDAPLDEFLERARKAAKGLPCDPRGSVLFQTEKVEAFIQTAKEKSAHYGKHGIRAFLAAHHLNCIISSFDPRPTSGADWQEYNDALDRLDEMKRVVEEFRKAEDQSKFIKEKMKPEKLLLIGSGGFGMESDRKTLIAQTERAQIKIGNLESEINRLEVENFNQSDLIERLENSVQARENLLIIAETENKILKENLGRLKLAVASFYLEIEMRKINDASSDEYRYYSDGAKFLSNFRSKIFPT